MASVARASARVRVAPAPWSGAAGRALLHLVVVALCVLTIFPLFWMVSTAFKPEVEIFEPGIRLLPEAPTLENFPLAFRLFPTGLWFFNSLVISVAIMAGKLLLSLPAAYAFAHLRFRGKRVLFALTIATMIVPFAVTIVPAYLVVAQLDWINTKQGVIVPSIAHTAFYIFLLRQFMLSLPQEIIDAARIDGAGSWAALRLIVIPNIRPAIAVVAVLAFLGAWNQYIWPLLILNDLNDKTLAIAMQFFAGNAEANRYWGPMMATATLAVLPPLLIYAFAQKSIISTFVTSGLKG